MSNSAQLLRYGLIVEDSFDQLFTFSLMPQWLSNTVEREAIPASKVKFYLSMIHYKSFLFKVILSGKASFYSLKVEKPSLLECHFWPK